MNPLDFSGPAFLFFYSVLVVVVFYVTRYVRRRFVDGDDISQAETPNLVSDPYAIAYLRGGSIEALRVALMSLTDRGLIVYSDGKFQIADGVELSHARRPLERAVLGLYVAPGPIESLASIRRACLDTEKQLQRVRLMPDDYVLARRRWLQGAVLLVLGGLAVAKYVVGIGRGKPVVFLVIAATIGLVIAVREASPRITRQGEDFLESVRRLFAALRKRAGSIPPGGATADLALLAAAYGIHSVPMNVFPHTLALYPRDGSSSSFASSCGSGCGGGGCGGCGGGD